MIKKIEKPKKSKKQTIKYWQRKADKQLQEIGRIMYKDKGCIICGGEYSCLHHFWPKSQSTYLRYNLKNCINICAGHHLKHHNGDPEIHAKIIQIKGQDWYDDLLAERNKNRYVNAGYTYYRDMYEKLSLLTPYKI
jgi:5-methylcytosine-specific restriction endonuclease McrA